MPILKDESTPETDSVVTVLLAVDLSCRCDHSVSRFLGTRLSIAERRSTRVGTPSILVKTAFLHRSALIGGAFTPLEQHTLTFAAALNISGELIGEKAVDQFPAAARLSIAF